MTAAKFVEVVQDFCGAVYTRAQMAAVAEWAAGKKPRRLDILYRYLTQNWETEYKNLPSVKTLKKLYSEMVETYPPL